MTYRPLLRNLESGRAKNRPRHTWANEAIASEPQNLRLTRDPKGRLLSLRKLRGSIPSPPPPHFSNHHFSTKQEREASSLFMYRFRGSHASNWTVPCARHVKIVYSSLLLAHEKWASGTWDRPIRPRNLHINNESQNMFKVPCRILEPYPSQNV